VNNRLTPAARGLEDETNTALITITINKYGTRIRRIFFGFSCAANAVYYCRYLLQRPQTTAIICHSSAKVILAHYARIVVRVIAIIINMYTCVSVLIEPRSAVVECAIDYVHFCAGTKLTNSWYRLPTSDWSELNERYTSVLRLSLSDVVPGKGDTGVRPRERRFSYCKHGWVGKYYTAFGVKYWKICDKFGKKKIPYDV